MKTSIINGSEVSRFSVAIQTARSLLISTTALQLSDGPLTSTILERVTQCGSTQIILLSIICSILESILYEILTILFLSGYKLIKMYTNTNF